MTPIKSIKPKKTSELVPDPKEQTDGLVHVLSPYPSTDPNWRLPPISAVIDFGAVGWGAERTGLDISGYFNPIQPSGQRLPPPKSFFWACKSQPSEPPNRLDEIEFDPNVAYKRTRSSGRVKSTELESDPHTRHHRWRLAKRWDVPVTGPQIKKRHPIFHRF